MFPDELAWSVISLRRQCRPFWSKLMLGCYQLEVVFFCSSKKTTVIIIEIVHKGHNGSQNTQEACSRLKLWSTIWGQWVGDSNEVYINSSHWTRRSTMKYRYYLLDYNTLYIIILMTLKRGWFFCGGAIYVHIWSWRISQPILWLVSHLKSDRALTPAMTPAQINNV